MFKLLGNSIGRTLMVDKSTVQKKDLEVGRVRIFFDKMGCLPVSIPLWVEFKYSVEIRGDEEEILKLESQILGEISQAGFRIVRGAERGPNRVERKERGEEDDDVSDK